MVKVIASSVRKGNVLDIDGKLVVVMKAENIHPGKGTPVTHLDMRRISDGVKITERYRTTDQVERAFLEEADAEGPRDIDVLFVGNVHPAVQGGRLPWLGRLARLAGRYNVLLTSGVFGDAYRALLRRSRIAFNHSIRSECNRRVFEAAACGARALLQKCPVKTAPRTSAVSSGETA